MSADILDFVRPVLAVHKEVAKVQHDLGELARTHAELQDRAAVYHRCAMLATAGLALRDEKEREAVMDKVLSELKALHTRYGAGGDR